MDPFSLGASILGVIGLTIQVGEILVKFGMDWTYAPDDVKHFIMEIQTLKTTLSTTYTNAITNPEFEKAMRGTESALLSHFKQKESDSGQLDFPMAMCKERLQKLLAELRKASKGSKFGWSRLKMAFLASDIREAVEDLHCQCQVLNNLIGIDSLTLGVETLKEIRAVRQEANEDRKARQDWESRNDNILAVLKDEQDDRSQTDRLQELSRFLKLISASDYASEQRDYLSKRTEGTGRWLLESETYPRWVEGTGGTFFCSGMPGSGKTIMSSIVTDNLNERIANLPDIYLAFIYCNFRRQHEQSPGNILSSILRQLIQQQYKVPDYIKSLYSRTKTLPNLSQIANALELCIKEFSKGYVVIDALDELSTDFGTLKALLKELNKIQIKTGLNLFVTTRPMYEPENLFDKYMQLEIRADDVDVEKYVHSRLSDLPKYVEADASLQTKIQSTIVKHVQGMFLLAGLHLESLMSKKSPTAMRKALKELNISDDTYEIAYEKAMHRILHGQTDDHRELAKQVLSWITFARRPLTIEELQHAVAVELDDCEPKSFDHNNITDLDLILSVCAGLVTIDKLAGVIRLVHHTAQQYFVQTRDQHFPQGEIQIANTCIQYLSYRNVATGQFFSREQYYTRLQQWPLFGYASEYWHEHMDKVKYLNACNFLQNESASVGPYQAAVITKYAQFEESNYYWVAWDFDSGSAHSMALHWAAFIGHEAIACDLWKKGYDVNQEDFEGMTPLMVAARQGHSKLVRVMLQEWRVEARTTHRRVSPLLYAATFNQADVVTVLLELTDVDDEGSPPLGQAIALGHTKIVELLLADPRVYPYVRIKDGGSGLTIAAALGFSDIVQLLLTKDEVDVNHLDGNENTALHLALIHGHREISQQLINDPRTYEQLDNGRGLTDLSLVLESGDADLLSRLVRNLEVNLDRIIEDQKTTPLVLAVQTGHVDIVLSMLRIPMLDINAKDEEGRTALSWVAIGNTGDGTHKTSIQRTEKPVSQRMAILETLLALDGIDPEIRDNKGWSPLFYAADGTCEETVSLLLSRGRVQVNALGPYATTALFHVKSAPIARLLLDARADVAWKNTKGNTPLMHIYHEDHGCHDVLELLCREADLHEVNGDSETVLLQAAKRGDPWMVNLLLRNGAEADNSGKQKSLLFLTLEYAPKAVSDDFVEFCAREEAAFAYDKSLATDTGAMRGSADQACRYRTVIGLLLKWGADKHSLSRLDLLKLKSKKSSTQLGFAD